MTMDANSAAILRAAGTSAWGFAVVMVFFEAGVTLVGLLIVLLQGRVPNVTMWSFTDVFTLAGLGIALSRRFLWAPCVLVGYAVLDASVKVHAGTSPWVSLFALLLYAGAAVHLHAVGHSAPPLTELPWMRLAIFAVVFYAGNFGLSAIFGFGYFPVASPVWSGFIHVEKGSALHFSMLMGWALVLFTRVAIRTAPWSFECVVLVALLSWPLGVIDWAWGAVSALQWTAGIVYSMAFAMCGWGVGEIVLEARDRVHEET
jgi:hypothetical protein